MRLYLCQHGEAKKEEEDPARPLTEKGRADAKRVAHHATARAGVWPLRITHSGKLRARQTAALWAEYLPSAELLQADGLDPLTDPRPWADRLQQTTEDIMLVGHLPHLERLTSLLVCGDDTKRIVSFQNGGVVCLQRDEGGRWSIDWALTPTLV